MSRALTAPTATEPVGLLSSIGSRATVDERVSRGRAIRKQLPRVAHTGWTAPPTRRDPISVLEAQAADRLTRSRRYPLWAHVELAIRVLPRRRRHHGHGPGQHADNRLDGAALR